MADLRTQIADARSQGYSDDDIFGYLQGRPDLAAAGAAHALAAQGDTYGSLSGLSIQDLTQKIRQKMGPNPAITPQTMQQVMGELKSLPTTQGNQTSYDAPWGAGATFAGAMQNVPDQTPQWMQAARDQATQPFIDRPVNGAPVVNPTDMVPGRIPPSLRRLIQPIPNTSAETPQLENIPNADPNDPTFLDAMSRVPSQTPDWVNKLTRPFLDQPINGSPVGSFADALPTLPESKGEAALMAGGALIPPAAGKLLKGARGALSMLKSAAPEVEAAAPAAREYTGIFAPETPPVRGATAQEIQAMQKGTLSDQVQQELHDAGKGNPIFREGSKYLLPGEAEKIVASQGNIDKFSRLLKVLPDASNMAAMAKMGQPKQGWYRASTQAILDLFGQQDGPRFAAVLAAGSPQTSVESNLTNSVKIWANWVKEGRPTDEASIMRIMGESVQGEKGQESVLDAWKNNTIAALKATDLRKLALSGPKVDSFYRNLQDDIWRVTNDAHMARGMAVDQGLFAGSGGLGVQGMGPGYIAGAVRTRQGGALAGMHPSESQETAWSTIMRMYEESEKRGMTPREFLDSGQFTPDVIRGAPDFSTLFKQGEVGNVLRGAGYESPLSAMIQHQWPTVNPSLTIQEQREIEKVANRLGAARQLSGRESRATSIPVQGSKPPNTVYAYGTPEYVPGADTGHFPNLISAPFGSRSNFSSRVAGAFRDAQGQDILHNAVGLNTIESRGAMGAYRPPGGEIPWIPGSRNPLENQPAFAEGVELPLTAGRDIRPADKARMNAVAAVRGAETAQLGSAWNASDPSESGRSLFMPREKKATPDQMGLAATLFGPNPAGPKPPASAPLDERLAWRARQYGGPNVAFADTGKGVAAINFGKQFTLEQQQTLGRMLGDSDRYWQANNINGYIDYANEWKEQPGSGAVVKKMLSYVDELGKGDYASLDREVRKPAGRLLDIYETAARNSKQPVRADLMNMLKVMRDEGLTGVRKALSSGGFLPAIGAAVLAQAQYGSQSTEADPREQ